MASGTTSPGSPDPRTVRNRKRFTRRQWARRWLAWKWVAAVLVLILLVVGGTWLVYFSSVLAVQGVDVTGTTTVSASQIRTVARVPEGEPLASLDLQAIRSRVESLAVVREADVSRKWPDQVLITVEERVPVAVVDIGGRIRGMDATGVVFRDYAKAPDGLPRVETETGTRADALREAAEVVAALPPALARQVDHVEVKTVDQIALVLKDERRVEWGSADESATKAEVLTALLRRDATTYDVSVPGQATTSN